MKIETIVKIKLKEVKLKVVNKVAGQGKLKVYDQVDSLMTRYFVPAKSLTDFYDGKIDSKKQLIQTIITILLWIAPIKWLVEYIVFQYYDYHQAAYYTSYYGMVYGKDEASFISLAISICFTANYYHSFSKLMEFLYQISNLKLLDH